MQILIILKICKSTYNQGHSHNTIVLKYLTYLSLQDYRYSPHNTKRQIKILLCNENKINTTDSIKKLSDTGIIKMLDCFVLFIAYLLCLENVFFNRQSAFLWVLTVLLFSPISPFILMMGGGRDRMVVGFTTTSAISAYHH